MYNRGTYDDKMGSIKSVLSIIVSAKKEESRVIRM